MLLIAFFFDIQTVKPHDPLLAFRIPLFKKLTYCTVGIGCPFTTKILAFT